MIAAGRMFLARSSARVIGGVLGHQVGSGRGRDVATAGGAVAGAAIGSNVGAATAKSIRRTSSAAPTSRRNDRPEYYDVTYNFNGVEHRVQLATPPGPTIAVNSNGEPRG